MRVRRPSWIFVSRVTTFSLSAANATVRKAFNYSSNSFLEIQWYLFSLIFLFLAGYTLKNNEHVRIDIITGRFSARVRAGIDIFGTLWAGAELHLVPPELNLERWHQSVMRLHEQKFAYIAPTHFGVYADPEWQLRSVEEALDDATHWMEEVMPANPSIEELRQLFTERTLADNEKLGLSEEVVTAYQLANPPGMSADGLMRYWKKVRSAV